MNAVLILALILLKLKVISLFRQYKARPACSSVLYTVCWPTSSFHLDIPENDNGYCQKWKVDYHI